MGDLPPLVFIHGIKGCNLQRGSKRVYLTMGQLFSLDTPDLKLPLQWDGDIQSSDDIFPGTPTQNVLGCLSGIVGAQGYAGFLKWCRNIYGKEQLVHGFLDSEEKEKVDSSKNLFVFTYDWRRDNNENSKRLLNFLEAVNEVKELKPQVVSHSNGGLLLWNCLNKKPDLASSVVFAGVPFGLGLSFLRDMHVGVTNGGFNKKHLSSEVYFTHPCYYCYFTGPADDKEKADGSKYPDVKQLVKDSKGNPVDFDVASAQSWEDYGILLPKLSGAAEDNQAFLQKCLDQAKLFREEQLPKQDIYPPVTVLAGNAFDTRIGAVVDKENSSIDFDSWPPVPGDGRVGLDAAKPPAGCPFTLVTSDLKHAKLLDDVATVKGILEDLRKRASE